MIIIESKKKKIPSVMIMLWCLRFSFFFLLLMSDKNFLFLFFACITQCHLSIEKKLWSDNDLWIYIHYYLKREKYKSSTSRCLSFHSQKKIKNKNSFTNQRLSWFLFVAVESHWIDLISSTCGKKPIKRNNYQPYPLHYHYSD